MVIATKSNHPYSGRVDGLRWASVRAFVRAFSKPNFSKLCHLFVLYDNYSIKFVNSFVNKQSRVHTEREKKNHSGSFYEIFYRSNNESIKD